MSARVVRTSGCWWLVDDDDGSVWRVLDWPADGENGVIPLGEASEGEASLLGDLLAAAGMAAAMRLRFRNRPIVLSLPVTAAERAGAELLRPEHSPETFAGAFEAFATDTGPATEMTS